MDIELLAPAGNKKSFLAAVINKADAVYLGLSCFNARKPAENFNTYEFKQAVNYAHAKGVKVYLTLNIDLKSSELHDAIQLFDFAFKTGADAIIIKDPSLLLIHNKFFADKEIHLSTQFTVLNSLDAIFAKEKLVKRAILARELSIDEIKAISEQHIEIEVFTEGSMCFSISGRCLMSSFVGGRSGNRGSCTAPCRVNWQKSKAKFSFFSMKDISLINHLDELKSAGVLSVKIEGRLKHYQWVDRIVTLYRDAIDKGLKYPDIKSILGHWSGRDISTGHIFSHKRLIGSNLNKNENKNENIINETKSNILSLEKNIFNLPIKLNCIRKNKSMIFELVNNSLLLRFDIEIPLPPKKAKSFYFNSILNSLNQNITEYNIDDNIMTLELSSTFIKSTISLINKKTDELLKNILNVNELNHTILSFIEPKKINQERKKIFGDIPDRLRIKYTDIDLFLKNPILPIETLIIYINTFDLSFDKITDLCTKYKSITISLPDILYENELKSLKNTIQELIKIGIKSFEANSNGQINLLSKYSNLDIQLGPLLPVYNYLSSEFYMNQGVSSVYIPYETDINMIRDLSLNSRLKTGLIVYGRVPLFYSRVSSKLYDNGSIFEDNIGIKVEVFNEFSINIFAGIEPINLINEDFVNKQIKLDFLTADFRFDKTPYKSFKNIINKQVVNNKSSSLFNLTRKLI